MNVSLFSGWMMCELIGGKESVCMTLSKHSLTIPRFISMLGLSKKKETGYFYSKSCQWNELLPNDFLTLSVKMHNVYEHV